METRCDTVSGELHATFMDNSPSGSHALSLVAPPVALPVTRQRPGTVNTVAANNLPKPTVTEQGTIHRLATTQPPPTPIFPHQQAEKSPQNQHVWSFNPIRKLRSPGTPAESRGCWRRRRDLNPRGAMHPYLLSREAHSTGLCDVSSADYSRAFSPRALTAPAANAQERSTQRRARDSNPRCHC